MPFYPLTFLRVKGEILIELRLIPDPLSIFGIQANRHEHVRLRV